MLCTQEGILAETTKLARYLSFSISSASEIRRVLPALGNLTANGAMVVGIGPSLAAALNKPIQGLCTFPALSLSGIDIPSTPTALWCWLRGDDRGELFHRGRHLESLLSPAFTLDEVVDAFRYRENRDLTGYIDGTENPKLDAAIAVACVTGQGPGLDGSSYVAVQQWVHDFEVFDEMSSTRQDNTIGRSVADNQELTAAPASAHVKRTAQENFTPAAYIVRRSMPWSDDMHAGLMFVAFGRSFTAFAALLQRMSGAEDGITDAVFQISRPVTGAYYWCPPVKNTKLDLSALGL